MEFAKYHGCGNDFIIIEEYEKDDSDKQSQRSYKDTAITWCNRKTGMGADGLIVVTKLPALNQDTENVQEPKVEMSIYNSDGSRAPMCGNGIRCFAQYCHDNEIINENEFAVKTLAGDMNVKVIDTEPFITQINLGKPSADPEKCRLDVENISKHLYGFDDYDPGRPVAFIDIKINLEGKPVPASILFMGAIHTVVWSDALDVINTGGMTDYDSFTKEFGNKLSDHPFFKDKTNVNMARVIDRNTIALRTYERGAGMTAACGTGAAASVVIGIAEGKLDNEVDVILPYGQIHITRTENGEILMQGPSVKVADGSCYI